MMEILGGSQHKAERIARELVKDLTVKDIYWVVEEGLSVKAHEQLLSAVEDDFLEQEKRRWALSQKLRDALSGDLKDYFEEFEELTQRNLVAQSVAHFHLGYFAALRLLGRAPELALIDGGCVQR